MFERYAPSADTTRGQARGQERTALRALAWSELTARIDAARDLRQVLRNDTLVEATSFADAAGGYFVSEGNSKQRVNPNDLEGRKGLEAIKGSAQNDAPHGDQEK